MANKKLFQDLVLTSTPSTSDRFALGKAGSAYKNITAEDLRTWILANVPPPYEPTLLHKVVDIGGWDMDVSNDTTKEVSLGVARSKIRSITVNIRSNTDGIYTFAAPAGNDEVRQWWRVMTESQYASNARIKLYSKDNGYFSQSAFNGSSGNRGWIYITYLP